MRMRLRSVWETAEVVIKTLSLVRLLFSLKDNEVLIWRNSASFFVPQNYAKTTLIWKTILTAHIDTKCSHCLTCSLHCKQTHGISCILTYGKAEMKAASVLSIIIKRKKKNKTGNPLKTKIFVLASSGNFVHPVKKISQTKSRVTECQTCLRWIIIVFAISRGSCARLLTQSIQRRCPDMSVTVKDLLACSWHL